MSDYESLVNETRAMVKVMHSWAKDRAEGADSRIKELESGQATPNAPDELKCLKADKDYYVEITRSCTGLRERWSYVLNRL